MLGPFEVTVDGRRLDLGGSRIRTVLALLAARAGRVVSVSALVEALWAGEEPADAHRTVRTYVSRLRRALEPAGDELIATHPVGYALRLPPGVFDAAEFEQTVTAARAELSAGRPEAAIERFSAAFGLWRGEAYDEFAETAPLRAEAARLGELRLAATEDRIDAELALGAGPALVDELIGLTERNPGHDRLWGQLMIALYRAGRPADALEVFRAARTVLVEEYGLDPSPALVAVHRQVLDNDPRLLAAATRTPPGPAATRNDLPGNIIDFTGRQAELARLLAAVPADPDPLPSAVVIEAIDGMAGVGKTTLAVHAAHRLADRYPDGALYIDLRGHNSGQPPMPPMTALDTLLRALGVPAERIPNTAEARSACWRAELASRSVLVLLDNAADAAQVRPLLPGTARSLVLITSRRRMVDLDTAPVLSLDVLPEADAIALFSTVVGDDRASAEADAVRDVVERCGYLPLAIRIAAARLRTRPAWTVRYLADRLRQARWPLAELAAGDRSVAAAFTLSYRQLDAAAQRMFRLLGVHPGPDFEADAAASIAAVSRPEAEELLENLVDVHLLQQPTAGRYRFHDLIGQHAQSIALAEESEPDRHRALRRVVDHYLHTSYHGSRMLDRQHPPIDIGAPEPGCVVVALGDDPAAMAWFDTNHRCVHAARIAAEGLGWDGAVWQLAWTLDNFHYRRGHIHDNVVSWQAGLAAAERLGDLGVQARAHRRLGLVKAPLGQADEAVHHLDRSLALSKRVGDTLGQAGAYFVLGLAWTHRNDDVRALENITCARDLYARLGESKWEMRATSLMGACHARLGHYEQARAYCESALELCLRHNDVYGQADSLESLGAIAGDTGAYAEALSHYERSLVLWREQDNTYRQAAVLAAIGDMHGELGRPEEAQRVWRQAIDLYRASNLHDAADRIEQRATRPNPLRLVGSC